MSLARTDFKRLAAAVAPFALVFGLAANDAKAEIPAVGQCGPAETVKAELGKAGYNNYLVYDVTLFDDAENRARWFRESFYANNGLSKGYYVGRRGQNDENLCVFGQISEIKLASNVEQARQQHIDPRFYKKFAKADSKDGLNTILNTGAERIGAYPMIQAKVSQANGAEGYITISVNPSTHKGGQIFSDPAGTVIGMRTQLEAGEKPMTGYTPVALSVLSQDKKNAAIDQPPVAALSLR